MAATLTVPQDYADDFRAGVVDEIALQTEYVNDQRASTTHFPDPRRCQRASLLAYPSGRALMGLAPGVRS